jgi:CheY-like chemotaxis protein
MICVRPSQLTMGHFTQALRAILTRIIQLARTKLVILRCLSAPWGCPRSCPVNRAQAEIMTLSGKQIRVFVVDDDYCIASTLALILSSHGYLATFFTKPLEALQAARFDAPDLLLSEVSLSLLSGIELAIQMRKRCPACKVLLFSGQPDTADLLETTRADGYSFEVLPKPIHPTHVLSEIQSLFGSIPLLAPESY